MKRYSSALFFALFAASTLLADAWTPLFKDKDLTGWTLSGEVKRSLLSATTCPTGPYPAT